MALMDKFDYTWTDCPLRDAVPRLIVWLIEATNFRVGK
jgi:hypothetical protein